MSSQSPAVVLYDLNGNAIAVQNGVAIPASTPAIILAGSDGTNSRYLTIDTSGRAVVVGAGTAGTATGGVVTIQGIAGGTVVPVSGTVTANAGTGNFTVIGTATDNTANSTAKLPVMAALANTSAPTWTNGNMVPLSVDTSGNLRITGSITATNPSVSTTGTAPPASATYLGGSVTTAAPSYTTGQMSALSLNLAGGLRVDGSGVTQPVSGTVSATQSGTWTVQPGNTANTTPWLATINQGGNSATVTASNALKVDGSAVTQPVSGTVAVSSVAGTVTVSGTVTANKSTASTVTSVAGATANTAILASNANRIAAAIYNNTTKNMYVLLNSGVASTSNFSIILLTNAYWEIPSDYTGAIQAVWASGVSGSCLVTEMT